MCIFSKHYIVVHFVFLQDLNEVKIEKFKTEDVDIVMFEDVDIKQDYMKEENESETLARTALKFQDWKIKEDVKPNSPFLDNYSNLENFKDEY